MVRRRFELTLAAAVLVPLLLCDGIAAQQPTRRATGGTESATTGQTRAAASERRQGVSDKELAAMLILQHEKQQKISDFAAKRAQQQKVKQFAEKVARQHTAFIEKLHASHLSSANRGQDDDVLQALADAMRDALRSPSRERTGERRVAGFRGDRNEAAATTRPQRENRSEVREQRQNVREERQDVGEARRDGRQQTRDERADVRDARQELREERQDERQDDDRRENARRFVRQVLPVLRANLPEILDVVGEAVDEDSAASYHSIALHKELYDRHAETIKQELDSEEGKHFDHAYLYYEILAHLEMVDAMETVRNYASPELRKMVEDGLQMTKGHLQQARQLASDIEAISNRN